jgi:hypothetical protein
LKIRKIDIATGEKRSTKRKARIPINPEVKINSLKLIWIDRGSMIKPITDSSKKMNPISPATLMRRYFSSIRRMFRIPKPNVIAGTIIKIPH